MRNLIKTHSGNLNGLAAFVGNSIESHLKIRDAAEDRIEVCKYCGFKYGNSIRFLDGAEIYKRLAPGIPLIVNDQQLFRKIST